MGFLNVQYWRSFEHLEAFAKNTDDPHLDVWRSYWSASARTLVRGFGTRPTSCVPASTRRSTGTCPRVGSARPAASCPSPNRSEPANESRPPLAGRPNSGLCVVSAAAGVEARRRHLSRRRLRSRRRASRSPGGRPNRWPVLRCSTMPSSRLPGPNRPGTIDARVRSPCRRHDRPIRRGSEAANTPTASTRSAIHPASSQRDAAHTPHHPRIPDG